jgi:hypothetical protein
MPHIHEATPRETYTIAGEQFEIFTPYVGGHALTEGEASQLNQVFAENIRNNRAKLVSELKEAGTFDAAAFQAELDDYMKSYEMGVRTGGGGRSSDPVTTAAMDLARTKVREAIVKAGGKIADYSAKDISEKAREAVNRNPKFLEIARAQVEMAESLTLTDGSDSPAGKKSKAA